VLITGAAGNLGGMLARHLLPSELTLRLMWHRRPLASDLLGGRNVTIVQADLRDPATLRPALSGADTVVHFAGVLFAPRPERFLPETNTRWFDHLVTAALDARVGRLILVSFPHVEGPTSKDEPATGRLDREPVSVHARTRLAEEKLLFERTKGTATTPVVLRPGMVYGRGVLMIEAARWLSARRLLAVWRDPTWIQLISTPDFLRATEAAIVRPQVHGVYHLGDEQPVTLQRFLDVACEQWGSPRPYRLPLWTIMTAASLCELAAFVARTPSPLTRDFISIGRVSYWGDTRRMREELLPTLLHPTLESGRSTL
jgi:nucleoside-diphosphate-sugar epimerase